MSLHEAFVNVLAAKRTEYNAQFMAARRAAPELDEDAFKEFLRSSLDPVVAAVADIDRAAVSEVVDAGYASGLELLAQRLAGPRAHHGLIDDAFRNLFPSLARFVARAPGMVVPRLCNALQQLATTPGARPAAWCQALRSLAPHIDGVPALLGVGQVSAWLCGLSHYRRGALDVCRTLPEPLVLAALGAQPGASLAALLTRLEADPWFVPSQPDLGFRVVGRIGGFRGFGGSFLSQPRVLRVERELFVCSADDAWLVVSDAFGCTLHRAGAEELVGATSDLLVPEVQVEATRASFRGKSVALLDTGGPSSVAGSASTVLIGTEHSYAVTILALEHVT